MSEQNQIYTTEEAISVTQKYCCAGCYGQLIALAVKHSHLLRVECPACGPDRGMVRKEFADRKRSESISELWEARANLGKLIPQAQPTGDPLAELGFGGAK